MNPEEPGRRKPLSRSESSDRFSTKFESILKLIVYISRKGVYSLMGTTPLEKLEKLVLISVIIPVYNGEKYLQACLSSVKACPIREIECIIVNDGSTDETKQICRKFSEKDPRFKLINRENSGVSKSRNIGLSEAVGDYVFFLDADDYIDSPKWPEILDHASKAYDMVAYGYYNLFGDSSTSVEQFPENCDVGTVLLSTTLFNTCWGKLIRREIIEKNNLNFREELKTCEDAIFMVDLVQNTEKFLLCNTPILFYRIHPLSVMQNTKLENKIADFTMLYERRRAYLAANYNKAAEMAMHRQCFSVITDLFRAYAKNRTISEIRKAYRVSIENTTVSTIMADTNKANLPLYKKLEYFLMSNGHYRCLAVYFKIKGWASRRFSNRL